MIPMFYNFILSPTIQYVFDIFVFTIFTHFSKFSSKIQISPFQIFFTGLRDLFALWGDQSGLVSCEYIGIFYKIINSPFFNPGVAKSSLR